MSPRQPATTRRLLALAAATAALAVLGGCYKPLFPADSPRNQFETYDKLRQRYVPLEEPDVFGNPRPALRARLTTPA
ncbi:MAG: hypothetical protein RI967_176 [Planctomycetota bacterium]|jgi:hypothetical protein